jgi:tRNA-modifying protein YgfZ
MGRADEYQAIREGAVIGSVAARGQLAVAGSDRASYLQGLLTNDIQALEPGSGCYSAWLTPQGRMITDLHVLESGNLILLDVPEGLADATLQRLDQFLFTEDVRLESLAGSLTSVWIHGPGAPSVLERTLAGIQDAVAWPDYRHASVAFGGAPVVIARIDQLGVPGYCVYVDPASREALRGALGAAGAVAAGPEAIDAARIEAGYPVFGIDMTEETIPLEAGIEDRAISLSKGCYVGQEIIIRVLHRGGGRVAKRLVAMRLDGEPPVRGAAVLAGDRPVGSVTSVAESPRTGSIALAYVHRDFVSPGTALEVEGREGRTPAVVTTRPIATAA